MGRMMGRVSSRLARVDWFIWAPALFLGAAALLVIGTIAFAAASIRCCADSTGTTATGWIIIGLLVLAAALGAGTIGAGIGWSIRRLARLISHQHRE